jgi:hypothetical protein
MSSNVAAREQGQFFPQTLGLERVYQSMRVIFFLTGSSQKRFKRGKKKCRNCAEEDFINQCIDSILLVIYGNSFRSLFS